MKIEKEIIAKNLRFIGAVYKIILPKVPNKKENGIKEKRIKKNSKNRYIKRDDNSYLRVLVKKPRNVKEKTPGVLWIHGGGYATGMLEMASLSMAKVITKKCVTVIPDYRLSVEKPYPAALNDCYQTLEWMVNNANELGINSEQIFIGGESAGGGLTIALCMYVRDNSNLKIAFQMPLYPMIDYRSNSISMKDNDAPVWNESKNKAAWKLYLDGLEEITKYASPSLEKDYSNLPPALTFVGSIEPFYDETIEYIENLKNYSVNVDYKVYEGCFHAFDMMVPWAKQSREAKKFFTEGFEYACKNYYVSQKK